MLPYLQNAYTHLHKKAIYFENNSFSYDQLIQASNKLAKILLQNTDDLLEQRIAFMVSPGFNYVQSLWGIWSAGGIAVPLCISHPLPSLEYVLEDTSASILIVSNCYVEVLQPYIDRSKIKYFIIEEINSKYENLINTQLPNINLQRRALILYTSGTTNKPKGVVTTHKNIKAQITTLIESWQWTEKDNTICVLPLHHVHGIINVVCCSLWVGASCTFIAQFSPAIIFDLFQKRAINVFMAVPTIYFKLMTYLESLSELQQKELKQIMQAFRLMVCGSAALPVSVMERWKVFSGHTLLERYGMTELGMAISNPYKGERRPGYVGKPLPGVQIKLVNEQYNEVNENEAGEIIVYGDNVFEQYWQKPEATADAFTNEGWFKTGDIAIVENDYYKILGRNSVDIIKSGGYKISALEIEEVLREIKGINDCAVVGIEDDEWGELIVAAIVVLPSIQFNEIEVTAYLHTKLASYKKPRKYLVVDDLPRNAMGKVVKNDVKKLFNPI